MTIFKVSKVPEQSKDVSALNKLVRVMLELAIADIKSQGVTPLIVETYRPQIRQNYLYCQGRTVAECVTKGINKAFAEAYCNPKAIKVTWTLNSVHKSRKAIDVVPQRIVDGKWKAIWNVNDPQTKIIIKIMQKYGFEAGAKWTTTPDSPHYQVKGTFSNVFSQKYNTIFVTKAVQTALNIKLNINLDVDGKWFGKTTDAVNAFRKSMGYKNIKNGQLGEIALRDLFSNL